MNTLVSIYIPNEIEINETMIGKSYKIEYDYDGINYKFIGKVVMGSLMNDGSAWIDFHNVKKYFIDNVKIDIIPRIINFGYWPDPYIPDANDIRIYKFIYGPDSNIMDAIKPFKLYYIKEFPYETTVNFRLLPTDINREIRSYIV